MLIYLMTFVSGILTILSPCILPLLLFVFVRTDQPFRGSGLPCLWESRSGTAGGQNL